MDQHMHCTLTWRRDRQVWRAGHQRSSRVATGGIRPGQAKQGSDWGRTSKAVEVRSGSSQRRRGRPGTSRGRPSRAVAGGSRRASEARPGGSQRHRCRPGAGWGRPSRATVGEGRAGHQRPDRAAAGCVGSRSGTVATCAGYGAGRAWAATCGDSIWRCLGRLGRGGVSGVSGRV
jgi:hypothetical protein